ncbi:MAG: Gfo/Idh/MocA family protein, partial [Anaerolineae bacterium]
MPQRPTIRVGLIGCGNIGVGGHAPAYARIPEARLIAVCDKVPERAKAVAAEAGVEPFQDYRSLLARDDIDMVDLCVPTDQHARLAIDALRAGKHVLCEKPMACTLAEADAMIEAARQTGRKLMIGHVRRFDHRYAAIKAAIDAGDVGRPVYIRRAERQWLPFSADAWYWHPGAGGVILDIGVHIADLFRWYFAQNPISVYAIGRQVRETARKADSFDHALITYHFPGGAVGLAEASWAYPPKFGSGLYASLDVVGTGGKVQYSDRDSNPMLVFDAESGAELPRYFRFMSTTEYAFQAEIEHFVQCIVDDRSPAISPEDARAALEMVLAAQ